MRISDWSSDVCSSDLPELSLKEAREEVEAARKLVKQGIHPSQQKKLDRIKSGPESANTFEAVAKEWLALKDWEDVTKKRRLAMLARVVFPHIGKLPLRQIVPAHKIGKASCGERECQNVEI